MKMPENTQSLLLISPLLSKITSLSPSFSIITSSILLPPSPILSSTPLTSTFLPNSLSNINFSSLHLSSKLSPSIPLHTRFLLLLSLLTCSSLFSLSALSLSLSPLPFSFPFLFYLPVSSITPHPPLPPLSPLPPPIPTSFHQLPPPS